MSPDVMLECPRTSFRDVLGVNVTERDWHSPLRGGGGSTLNEASIIEYRRYFSESVFVNFVVFFLAKKKSLLEAKKTHFWKFRTPS